MSGIIKFIVVIYESINILHNISNRRSELSIRGEGEKE